ncbi:MAG: DNA repair protein RecO [Deltaproteobacteria bacterium]|nr:DNA repair protein RecO [Deltaproteobacteria bacterium]
MVNSSGQSPFVSEAVLLGQVAFGESDWIVTLYTRTHGKLTALARTARRSRKRFGAALALLVLGEATLRERRHGEIAILERFDAVRDFSGLSADVVRMAHASYATELLRELTVPRNPDPVLLELLVEAYETFSKREPHSGTLRAYELKILACLGLSPVLDRCVKCGDRDPERLDRPGTVLHPGIGGAACAACVPGLGHGMRPLSAGTRKLLCGAGSVRHLEEAIDLPAATPDIHAQAREALHALLSTHLQGPLKSLEFIRKLRGS